MSKVWTIERLKKATIAKRTAQYKVIPATEREKAIEKSHPHIFTFEAISIGDGSGQAFLVPLDESGEGVAKLILKAIAAYGNGNLTTA